MVRRRPFRTKVLRLEFDFIETENGGRFAYINSSQGYGKIYLDNRKEVVSVINSIRKNNIGEILSCITSHAFRKETGVEYIDQLFE